ncbi:MAG: hypothetical protein OEU32_07280 [Acidimicrobiia bacterium]|nr:hypothetical protein [Acidimicrobiia bacterium]
MFSYGHANMVELIGIYGAATALLSIAGGLKLVDPLPAVAALRGVGVTASPTTVRIAAAGECLLGAVAFVQPSAVVAIGVGVVYAAFVLFVTVAMRAGDGATSCGCFGRDDTPPDVMHVILNGSLAAVAIGVATSGAGAPVEVIDDGVATGIATLAAITLLTYLLIIAYSVLPRTRAAVRAVAS